MIRQLRLAMVLVIFEAKRFRMYPLDIVTSILARAVQIILYVAFWSIVGTYSSSPSITSREAVGYYLLASGLTPFFFLQFGVSSRINSMIKQGEISRVLLQPLNPAVYPWAERIGRNGVNILLSIPILVAGFVVSGGLQVELSKLIVTIVSMFMLNWAFNMLLGTVAFYTVESSNIKNAGLHFSRILRGEIMPLFLMPVSVQQVIAFTPFPASQYYLVQLLRGAYVGWWPIIVGCLWAVGLVLLAHQYFGRSLQKYEAVGL